MPLNQWEVLTRFLEDGEWEFDNGATEAANRDIALGRGNQTFFDSDGGGSVVMTAAVFAKLHRFLHGEGTLHLLRQIDHCPASTTFPRPSSKRRRLQPIAMLSTIG